MRNRKPLGGLLREAREAAGLSMTAAAKRALISSSYVHAVEHGRRLPSLQVAARLANAVGADPSRAMELHKAAKHAERIAKGERLLARALADAGDPEGVEFHWALLEVILSKLPSDWLAEYAAGTRDACAGR